MLMMVMIWLELDANLCSQLTVTSMSILNIYRPDVLPAAQPTVSMHWGSLKTNNTTESQCSEWTSLLCFQVLEAWAEFWVPSLTSAACLSATKPPSFAQSYSIWILLPLIGLPLILASLISCRSPACLKTWPIHRCFLWQIEFSICLNTKQMKKRSEETQILCSGCSKAGPKISLHRKPPSQGRGMAKI